MNYEEDEDRTSLDWRPSKKTGVIFPRNTKEKIKLKKDDMIEFDEAGEIVTATVLSREKVSGRYYNYFNVRGEDGILRNIDLERSKFRKITHEECNMVIIPKS